MFSASIVAVVAMAGNPVQVFEGCGTIATAPFCGTMLVADAGGVWLLDDIGGFAIGDHVFVKGVAKEHCITLPECSTSACITVDTIEACGQSWFSGCGQVVVSSLCGVAFYADDGSGLYLLADFPRVPAGEHFFVEGAIEARCSRGGACACIHNEGHSACVPSGDLNSDGFVNGQDLGIMLGAWGSCPPLTIGCTGDLNYDGAIDAADLGILLGAWTQ